MDYLKLPLKTRLARFQKQKDESTRRTGWPRPEGGYYLIPELRPDADKLNGKWAMGQPSHPGTLLWLEDSESLARSIKYADEVLSYLHHTGYFVDQWQDETARGLVLTLPHGRFLAACSDPCNFDYKARSGPCILETGEVFTEERDAAKAADSLAESYAEQAREDDEKQQAEHDAEELAQAERDAAELELATEQAACWP